MVSLGYGSSWMDGTDQSAEGTWVTSAGDPLTFFNWDHGQPDNTGSGEHYVHYWRRNGWNDADAALRDHVLCAKTP